MFASPGSEKNKFCTVQGVSEKLCPVYVATVEEL